MSIQKPKNNPNVNIKEQQIKKSVIASNNKVTMGMLPDASLRARFVEKNNAFYRYCELKIQLNELAPEKEKEALDLILEIMHLNSFIDEVWREINYYLEHHKLLPKASDYSSLSYREQSKKLQLLYQQVSKRKSSIKKWESQLVSITDKMKKGKLETKIQRKIQELKQIEIDVETLKKLTNE